MDIRNFLEFIYKGKTRKTGESSTSHLYAVKNILEKEGVNDTAILVASLLHDILEDTELTKHYIALKFGKRVADIIEILSKQTCWKTGHCKMKSNLDEMEISCADYPEAVLIKMADRLHNLRTIHAFSKEKQREYVEETKELLIPLFRDTLKRIQFGDLRKWMGRVFAKLIRRVRYIEKHNQ